MIRTGDIHIVYFMPGFMCLEYLYPASETLLQGKMKFMLRQIIIIFYILKTIDVALYFFKNTSIYFQQLQWFYLIQYNNIRNETDS